MNLFIFVMSLFWAGFCTKAVNEKNKTSLETALFAIIAILLVITAITLLPEMSVYFGVE